MHLFVFKSVRVTEKQILFGLFSQWLDIKDVTIDMIKNLLLV